MSTNLLRLRQTTTVETLIDSLPFEKGPVPFAWLTNLRRSKLHFIRTSGGLVEEQLAAVQSMPLSQLC